MNCDVTQIQQNLSVCTTFTDHSALSLSELAARQVAAHIPFELVESYFPPVPEELQLRIAFWSFPEQVRKTKTWV